LRFYATGGGWEAPLVAYLDAAPGKIRIYRQISGAVAIAVPRCRFAARNRGNQGTRQFSYRRHETGATRAYFGQRFKLRLHGLKRNIAAGQGPRGPGHISDRQRTGWQNFVFLGYFPSQGEFCGCNPKQNRQPRMTKTQTTSLTKGNSSVNGSDTDPFGRFGSKALFHGSARVTVKYAFILNSRSLTMRTDAQVWLPAGAVFSWPAGVEEEKRESDEEGKPFSIYKAPQGRRRTPHC